MSSLAEIWVAVRPDTSGTGPELNRKLSAVDTREGATTAGRNAGHHFGSAMLGAVKTAAVGIGAALVGGGVIAGKFLKDAVGSASDLNETVSKTGVVFGKSSKDINKWAAAAAGDMGQTKQQALDAASTFGIFGKAANLTGPKLANFSIHLTSLAGDMASFSNTTPQDAIEALSSALRGEFDPIERYGVLLNQATLEQVALDKGIVKATGNQHQITAARVAARVALHNYNDAVRAHGKDSLAAQKASASLGLAQDKLAKATKGSVEQLTPQQRILAVQAALYDQLGKKGSGAIGDFERTSAGLANQQRILAANTANLKTEIGTGLLPVTTRFVGQLNSQVIPALQALWQRHGAQVVAFLTRAGDAFTNLVTRLGRGDFAGQLAGLRSSFSGFAQQVGPVAQSVKQDLVPALADLRREGGQSLSDTISVGAVAMKFLADHVDLLAKALPTLAVVLAAYKVAQLGANFAAAASPAIRIAEVLATRRQTAALTEMTAALAANRTAVIGSTLATGAETTAQNVGLLTRIRSTAAMIAQKIAMVAVRAATLAWTAVQWLLNAALTANPIGIVVVAIGLLVAAIILAYKHSETFRNIVNAAWAGIKVAITAVASWFINTLWPSLKAAYMQLMAIVRFMVSVWRAEWDIAKAIVLGAFNFIRDKVFNPLRTYITQTIPGAFRTGVAAVGKIWSGLQDIAKSPVRFIVDTVINKALIGTFNKVSGFFHGPTLKPVGLPAGFGDGMGARAASSARRAPRGAGDGFGFGDLVSLMKGPANWVKQKVAGPLGQLGNSPFAQILKGAGGSLRDSMIGRIKGLFTGPAAAGGGASVGGLQPGISAVLASLRGVFGNVPLISGFREGAVTLSGNRSYHALGRAVDIPPVFAEAAFLNAAYGRQLRELITPWNELNILNGRPHQYSGAIWNQHNFAGGNAHIHAAFANGGVIHEPIFGVGRSGRTYSFGERGPETIVPGAGAGGGAPHFHFHGPVASKQAAKSMVLDAYNDLVHERKIRS